MSINKVYQKYRYTDTLAIHTFRVVGRKMANRDVSSTFYSPLFISNDPRAIGHNIQHSQP